MQTETLAREALPIIQEIDWWSPLRGFHGAEAAPGWFILYNSDTGQSKVPLLHLETDLVFKVDQAGVEQTASGMNLGRIQVDNVKYRVRLPYFQTFLIEGTFLTAQEYVRGGTCKCPKTWCKHASRLSDITNCLDTHKGNWKIQDREIILFDYEGIEL
jgi:hypothetical protein